MYKVELGTSMRKHADSEALERGIERASKHAIPWSGTVFRATAVRYANRDDLLTGLGAKSAGGRWNPPGGFATIYSSLLPETALAEYLAQHRHFGWPDSSAMPYVTVAIEALLQSVLDLTNGPVRRALDVSRTRMSRGLLAPGDGAGIANAGDRSRRVRGGGRCRPGAILGRP